MAPREVSIDPESVQLGAWNASNATSDAATELAKHTRDIRAASEGWVGSSLAALEELVNRWEDRHTHHEETMGNVGHILNSAARRFQEVDDDSYSPAKPAETGEV